MLHQVKQAFSNPKFLVGFILFMLMLLIALIFPVISDYEPLEYVARSFQSPGTYVSVEEIVRSEPITLNREAKGALATLTDSNKEQMISWLTTYGGVSEDVDLEDDEVLLETWKATYSEDIAMPGALNAEKRAIKLLNSIILSAEKEVTLAIKNEEGDLEVTNTVTNRDYINVSDVINKESFLLGTDNFGSDVMTKLAASIKVSLRIGLVAGLMATLIGLTIGLIAGFVGGVVDNILTFITNIFTVIPSFVILILIANAVSEAARGTTMVSLIIGFTAWPWTARSVRSQVISLRGRDHVNLSKLSGHSMPRIIVQDILPYLASYVIMALILQISSGILSEAQLSMLGLGPSTTSSTTLGLMMSWAQKFSAVTGGYWWAYIPVVLSIAIITFSLNLMNTGLDQVFNPTLRE